MKKFWGKKIDSIATYAEQALAIILLAAIVILIVRFMENSIFGVWKEQINLTDCLEQAMTIAIGIEFVKMLCTHTPGTIIEVLLFATSRQMIVEHLNGVQTLLGIFAIAGLFAIRKYLFCSFDESEHIICRGSQTIGHVNLIAKVEIPGEKKELLRDVLSRELIRNEKSIALGACVYYKDCALRVDSLKGTVITRVEVIKSL